MSEITDKQAFNTLIFIISFIFIGILTTLSWILAFGNDEGGPSTIGLIGYYSFHVFRFPTHNLIWLKPELISKLFAPGLLINVLLYSALTTFFVSKLKNRRRTN
jgi:hypothetical protein